METDLRAMALPDPDPEEDPGVELTLGLAVGGSSKRAPKAGPARRGSEPGDAEAGLAGPEISSATVHGGALPEAEGEIFWREMVIPAEDREALEAQAAGRRDRDRVARESEVVSGDRWSSGRTGDAQCPCIAQCLNPNPNPNPSAFLSQSPNLGLLGSHPIPVMSVQYAPVPNGCGFSLVMPHWAPAASRPAEGNAYHPAACRGLSDSAPAMSSDADFGGNSYLEMKGGKEIEVNGDQTSANSPGSSSSAVSDRHSGFLRVRRSNRRSHSSHPTAEKEGVQLRPQGQQSPPHSMPCRQLLSSSKAIDKASDKLVSCAVQSTLTSTSKMPAAVAGKAERTPSVNKPSSNGDQDGNGDGTSSLRRMPCVSTTGNGPNGRTITGFLYRYTKSEVSIICVCHGSSFSPAEFVRHAGGTDVSQPLKQIVVVPKS